MKTKRFLFLLPLIALASCSTLGQSINRDRALEIAEDIEAEEFQLLENSFEARINSVSASGKGEEKTSSNSSVYIAYHVLDAEKGESELIYKVNQKVVADGETTTSSLAVYIAKDKETSTDDNTYYMGYAMSKKDDEDAEYKSAYESDDPTRFAAIQSMSMGALSAASAISSYLDPAALLKSFSDDEDALKEAGISINYYSSGSKNLAVKYEYKIPKESAEAYEDDQEYTKTSSLVVEYSNARFTKMETTSTTSFNNKSNAKYTINYKSSIKVSMPKGWDNYLED